MVFKRVLHAKPRSRICCGAASTGYNKAQEQRLSSSGGKIDTRRSLSWRSLGAGPKGRIPGFLLSCKWIIAIKLMKKVGLSEFGE
ncbi:hypothetical protein ELY21_10395 [Legionella sp. km535]|uniref:hypothetical protein n=1 Tax=Legionella sp. km535 TaxID=2498107 RepID=UPI000F8C3A52|nr:hypothetical protein [Legionella sp. km535]RUR17714.1 hypothetical protein ELY21_10395 [Legionella sp. km535]